MGHKFYLKNGKIQGYKTRNDYIDRIDIKSSSTILFHPLDIIESRAPERIVYGEHTYKYTVIITGVMVNGDRAEVILDDLPIYFDVKVLGEPNATIYEINSIIKEFFLKLEVVENFPGVDFHEDPQKYIRIHFPNVFNRDKALERIIQAQMETATDFRKSQWLNHSMVSNEFTVSDWCILKPKSYERVDDPSGVNKHVFFVKPDGYIPVNRPLSKESLDVSHPERPIFFKFAWDIEVYSSTSEFPQPDNVKDDIFMIGVGIYISTQEEPIHTICICHKPLDYNPDEIEWDLIETKDEKETLLAFMDILAKFQPEFRLAFNNYGFDNPFVFKRANQPHMKILSKVLEDISPLPVDYYRPSKKVNDYLAITAMEKIKMEGSYDSNSEKHVVKIPGTIDIDMMVYLKRSTYKKEDTLGGHALRSYLNRYQLPNKLDIEFTEMQRAYREGDTQVMKEVADYCVVDALSCERLQNVTGAIMGLMSLAHISMTSIYNCMVRAGGSRIQNALYCQGYRNNVIYTDYPKKTEFEGKYPGAIVFNPIKGRYLDSPIMALDYQSLYPSIMRALWMSSETFTNKDTANDLKKRGYDVFDFSYPLNVNGEETDVTVYFVREDPSGNKLRGVFPQCLELLMDLRIHYKAEMKRATNKVQKQLFDEKQKATKILMNTAYGKIGSPMFPLYNVFISSAITMYGRKVLTLAKTIGEDMGYKLIYGDTDSIFIKAEDNTYDGLDTADRVAKAQDLARPVAQEINRQNRLLLGDKDNFDKIKMNLDKFLHPATFCAKKKYLGKDWDIGDKEGALYISGLEVTKRGKTELLKDTSYKVIEKLNDFSYRGGVVEAVEEILRESVEEISQKPRDYFFKKQKFTEGKTGSMCQFMDRMKKCAKENPTLYNLPNSGEYVEVAIVKTIDHLRANGCLRKSKISDRMEFRNIIEHLDLEIDIKYYLEDIIGTLARFINYDDRFLIDVDVDKLTPDEVDKKVQVNAEKYLREKLEEYTGGTGYLELTQVKRNRKLLHQKYQKYGSFVQTMINAYDGNIGNNLVNFTIMDCKTNNENSINHSMTQVEITEKIMNSELYIENNRELIENVYKKYREDIKQVSKGIELDSIEDDYIEPLQQIQKNINMLRKYNSMRSIDDMDSIELALEIIFK